MSLYPGTRNPNGATVTKDGKPLPFYLGVVNHSPDGFEWGYSGSGPAQLALALCCDLFGVDPNVRTPGFSADAPPEMARALRCYQQLKSIVLAPISVDTWGMTSEELLAIITRIEAKRER